jgi:hypothetical protein
VIVSVVTEWLEYEHGHNRKALTRRSTDDAGLIWAFPDSPTLVALYSTTEQKGIKRLLGRSGFMVKPTT